MLLPPNSKGVQVCPLITPPLCPLSSAPRWLRPQLCDPSIFGACMRDGARQPLTKMAPCNHRASSV